MSLAERLRLLRGDTGQSEFAARIGSSQSGVSAYEKGQRKPDYETLIRVSEEFKVSFEWLLQGKGPMHKSSGENLYQNRDSTPCDERQPIEIICSQQETQSLSDRDCVSCESQNLNTKFSICPTCQTFSDEHVTQPTENIERQIPTSVAVSDTSAIQTTLIESYKATAALQRELTDSIRENADLRVELERQKAQLRDLERENADLRKAMKPARLSGMDGQSVA